MNPTATNNWVTQLSLGARLGLLAFVLSLAALVCYVVGVLVLQASVQTLAIAWLVCLLSALVAHVAGEYPRGDLNFMARLAVQMVVRTALPFGTALWGLYFVQPPLETSLVFYILLFYLISLVVDVQLTLARINENPVHSEHLKAE